MNNFAVNRFAQPPSGLLMVAVAFCFSLVIFPATVFSLDFPYVVNVDHLACETMVADNPCQQVAAKPSLVARRTTYGCGYFRQDEGPLKNRWFEKCDPVFVSGYARVCSFGKDNAQACGLIDEELNFVIPMVYDELRLMEDVPIVAVNYRNKWGYFSLTERRLLFTPQFSYVSDFNDGKAYVIDADQRLTEPAWIIDDKGLRVAPVNQSIKVLGHFSEGLIPAEIDFRWGYLNSDGNWAIVPQFFAAEPFVDGMAAVQYGANPDQWAIINPTGAGLIFFEGSAHHLTMVDKARAQLSIGCESEGWRKSDNGSLISANVPDRADSTDQTCFRLCFEPLEKKLTRVCKTE